MPPTRWLRLGITGFTWVIISISHILTATSQDITPCAVEGITYDLQPTHSTTMAASEPEQVISPDGRSAVIKDHGTIILRTEGHALRQLADDTDTTRLHQRAFWSYDSRYLLISLPEIHDDLVLITLPDFRMQPVTGFREPFLFLGWSPDSRHLLFRGQYPSFSGLAIWSIPTSEISYGINAFYVRDHRWSPDGNWLAYTWRSDDERDWLVVVSPDGSVQHEFDLTTPGYTVQHQRIIWAPDSQHVALETYLDTISSYHLRVAGIDGSLTVLPSDDPGPELFSSPVIWFNGGRGLSFVQHTEDDSFTLMALYPTRDTMEVVADRLVKPPFFDPSRARVAVDQRIGETRSITIVEPGSGHVVPLAEGVTDAGDPDWSPDGAWVLITWAASSNAARTVRLTWIRADGSSRHTIDDSFTDIHTVHWLRDIGGLAFIAREPESGTRLEITGINSGARRVLREGLETIEDLTYDPATDRFTFWWKTANGVTGLDAIQSDGTPVFHIPVNVDLTQQRTTAMAPDEQALVVKTGQFLKNEILVLGFADGRAPLTLRTGLHGLGDPRWSPDSRLIAFTQQTATGRPATLEILSREGDTLWSEEFSPVYQATRWIECPAPTASP